MKINERLIWKAVIVALILIVFLFAWQEWSSFSIKEKINHDKVAAFATSVAAILTAATVYLLFIQIKEQKKDRKLESHPLIYAQPFYMSRLQTRAEIFNVGKGIATDVNIKFDFDRDNFGREFGDKDIVAVFRESDTKIDFILPSEMNGFNLPISYTTIILQYISNVAASIIEKYALYVKITYKDFYGEKLCVRYKVRITDQKNDYSFYVEFERLSDSKDCMG